MSEAYWRNFLLAPDKEHKKVFPELPIVGLRNGKSLKDYLVRVALPKMDNGPWAEEKKNGYLSLAGGQKII